jgi:hypothetical protein
MESKVMLENVEAIEAKKPAKLFIATPMYGGMCVGGYTMGILNCVQDICATRYSDVLLIHDE